MKVPKLSVEKRAKLDEIEEQAKQLLSETSAKNASKDVLIYTGNNFVAIPKSYYTGI